MSALALSIFQRHEHGIGRSFALSALVHVVLAAVLFLGVRWQVHPPDAVSGRPGRGAPPPPPAPVVRGARRPTAAAAEGGARGQAAAAGAEARYRRCREKPKPKPKPKPEPKKVEAKPKADPSCEKRMREQLAQEQKALDQQRQERQLRELLARAAGRRRAQGRLGACQRARRVHRPHPGQGARQLDPAAGPAGQPGGHLRRRPAAHRRGAVDVSCSSPAAIRPTTRPWSGRS